MGLGINIPDPLERFRIFLPGQAHTLPSFYWNVYNDEQRVKYLCCLVDALLKQQDRYVTNNNEFNKALKELADAFDNFVESGFDDYYKEQVEKWLEENLEQVFASSANQIFFGLTDDGYFCAYLPDSWSDIIFDTGAVYGRSDYGRLILRYNVDNAQGVIDNTYNTNSYTTNDMDEDLRAEIERLQADVETAINRFDDTYNTLYTNLTEVVSDGNF